MEAPSKFYFHCMVAYTDWKKKNKIEVFFFFSDSFLLLKTKTWWKKWKFQWDYMISSTKKGNN